MALPVENITLLLSATCAPNAMSPIDATGSNSGVGRRLSQFCVGDSSVVATLTLQVRTLIVLRILPINHTIIHRAGRTEIHLFLTHSNCPPPFSTTAPVPNPVSLYSPHMQDPSASEIDAIVASLYHLLASSANPLGACSPASALGAGWIQSTTQAAVLSAVSGVGMTQPVTPCDSEWGAAVVEQVCGGKGRN